jgi:hypothetical protein
MFTTALSSTACMRSDSAAAAASSTSDAFCIVISSSCDIALSTRPMSACCDRVAVLIWSMMSLTRCTPSTTLRMVSPACPTRAVPAPTFATESSISALISFAAAAERCARLRTSPATTANPRPCSPARAASTAAFSARMFVWNAMPSMTEMMSTILRDDSWISCIVATTSSTAVPPSTETVDAVVASALACLA